MDSTPEKTAPDARPEYGLEVLCASWNPLAAAIADPGTSASGRELVTEAATADVETFLASFYRSQQG